MKLNDLLLPEVKKVFYGWLQQQGVLNKYKEAIKRQINNNVRDYDSQVLSQFINVSFTWSLTREGHTYWKQLHKKWKSYITGYVKTHSKFREWTSENNISLEYTV